MRRVQRTINLVRSMLGRTDLSAVADRPAPNGVPPPPVPRPPTDIWSDSAMAGATASTGAASHRYIHLNTPDGRVYMRGHGGAMTLMGKKVYPPAHPPPPLSKVSIPHRSSVRPLWDVRFPPRHALPAHPTRWEFPAYLDNPASPWLQTLKDRYASPLAFPASLSPEAGLLVHALVRNLRPRRVIETGTFIGVSTLWIAAALAANGGGVVHTFDDFSPILRGPWRDAELAEGRLDFVARAIARAGLAEHVVIHPGSSSHEIRAVHDELRADGGVQLAFLDADHGISGAWHDFWATEPALDTGGYVLLHDTFPWLCSHEGPRHILDHLGEMAAGTYEKMDLHLSPLNYGLGLIRRVG